MEIPLKTILEITAHISKKHPEVANLIMSNVFTGFSDWANRDFSVPCPKFIKDSVLRKNNLPNSTWIETGTYLGETTELLSKVAQRVFTLEPEPMLFSNAKSKFETDPKVTVINQISEIALPQLLPDIHGNVCFWLDGHYSACGTFAGPNDTPLVHELGEISKHLSRFTRVFIAIDDIRFCGKLHAYGYYPSLDWLVNYSRENKLYWNIEYDMFLMNN